MIYKLFLNCEANNDGINRFIETFRDNAELGKAIFEFHNEREFRIYIESEKDDNHIMLTFNAEF